MKKLLLLLISITFPMLVFSMDTAQPQKSKNAIIQIMYAKFIKKIREGKEVSFRGIPTDVLTHALYEACLYNKKNSVSRIVNYTVGIKSSLGGKYANLGLLLATIYRNSQVIKFLNHAKIVQPLDIHEALNFAIDNNEVNLFFQLVQAKNLIDPTHPLAKQAMDRAVRKNAPKMVLALHLAGIPLEDSLQTAFVVKHPRIHQIRTRERKTESQAIKVAS